MALDATGTPTPNGIPKYRTNTDRPTGKGFNAAMDVLDGLVTSALVTVVKKAGTIIGSRRGINLIQGNGIVLTVADDAANDEVDVTIEATAATPVPTGAIFSIIAATPDTGYLLLDGSTVSRTTYAALFARIGTIGGAGDGSTTFTLPDFRGRQPVGKGTHTSVDALGETEGAAIGARTPKHYHSTPSVPSNNSGASGIYVETNNFTGAGTGTYNIGDVTGSPDSGAYIVVNWQIKT